MKRSRDGQPQVGALPTAMCRKWLDENARSSSAPSISSSVDVRCLPPHGADRVLVASRALNSGDCVMTIPCKCMVMTPAEILDRVKALAQPCSEPDGPPVVMSLSDVSLAIKLCLDLKKKNDGTPSFSSSSLSPSDRPFHASYYDTLPSMSYFSTALPLCWPEAKLRSLLRGSPLTLSKALRQQREIRRLHFDIVKKVSPSVTFEEFLYAFSNISTRSFTVSSDDGKYQVEGLIPFMDMSNHKRPRDLTFSLEYDDALDASSSPSPSNCRVVVKSLRNVAPGEEICITYGAKGNEALLLSYGFCLLNNSEPDGSSNDVFSRSLGGDDDDDIGGAKQQYTFRLGGGASYSFGCFSKALEACRDRCRKREAASGSRNKARELEGDACRRLESYLAREIEKMARARATSAENVVEHYLDIIRKGGETAVGCGGDDWRAAEKHCCILGLSEVLTLQFYLNATRCLLTVLDEAGERNLDAGLVEVAVKKWRANGGAVESDAGRGGSSNTTAYDADAAIETMRNEASNVDKLIQVYCKIRLTKGN